MKTLRETRLSKDMPQTLLAGLARMSFSTISHVETGRFRLSETQARKLAKALDVEPGEVIELAEAVGTNRK